MLVVANITERHEKLTGFFFQRSFVSFFNFVVCTFLCNIFKKTTSNLAQKRARKKVLLFRSLLRISYFTMILLLCVLITRNCFVAMNLRELSIQRPHVDLIFSRAKPGQNMCGPTSLFLFLQTVDGWQFKSHGRWIKLGNLRYLSDGTEKFLLC